MHKYYKATQTDHKETYKFYKETKNYYKATQIDRNERHKYYKATQTD